MHVLDETEDHDATRPNLIWDGGTEYYHRDHLGSVIAITGDSGDVKDTRLLSFDAWGKRRHESWREQPIDPDESPVDQYTQEGMRGNLAYTGHEAVPEVGLIHMNGRVYDPDLGRFLSADPHIQAPTASQSYNRYSYVQNNPLRYTDPSGYFADKVFKEVGEFFQTDIGKVVAVVVAIWGGYAAYQAAASSAMITSTACLASTAPSVVFAGTVAGGAAFGAISGAASGVAQTGTFEGMLSGAARGGARGAISGAMFGGIGAYYGSSWTLGRVGLNSLSGGVSSELSGGRFEDGFRIALATSLLTYGNYKMRQASIKNASQNPDNINGESQGFFGDGKKLAGARRTIDPQTGKYMECTSLMGGCGGTPMPGTTDTRSSFFGRPYGPGSTADYINESFAGPHDFFRNATGSYDALGNSRYFTGFRAGIDAVANYTLVVPAVPFAVGAAIPSYLYPGLVIEDEY